MGFYSYCRIYVLLPYVRFADVAHVIKTSGCLLDWKLDAGKQYYCITLVLLFKPRDYLCSLDISGMTERRCPMGCLQLLM